MGSNEFSRQSLLASEKARSFMQTYPHARTALWVATFLLTSLYLVQVLILTFASCLLRISWQDFSGFAIVSAEEFGAAFLVAAGLTLLPALIISESLVYRISHPKTTLKKALIQCLIPAGQSAGALLLFAALCAFFTFLATQSGYGVTQLLIGTALICAPLFSSTLFAGCVGWWVMRQSPART